MRGNGLIVAFLVVVWAAYFVPLVLRRYDEDGQPSTIERLSPLSRTIKRRKNTELGESPPGEANDSGASGAVGDSFLTGQRAEEAAMQTEGQRPTGERPSGSAKPSRPAPQTMAGRKAARRRRRVLSTLIAITLIAVAAASIGIVSWWAVAVPAVLDFAWLVACRMQVRGEQTQASGGNGTSSLVRAGSALKRTVRGRQTLKRAKDASQPENGHGSDARGTAFDSEQTVEVSGFFADPNPEQAHVMVPELDLPEDALEEKLEIAVPVGSTSGGALWDPLPVTVPTYVTKPRAGRTVRTIDLGEPGTWTSGHIEGEETALPQRRQEAKRDVG